jgi:hypothetical protein
MWKYFTAVFTLTCTYSLHAQSVSENMLTGNWYVVRWQTSDRLLDFEDSAASVRFMIDNFKQKNKVKYVLKDDSLRISQELHKVMSAAEGLRFRLNFNKDKSFIWTTGTDNTAQYKGTYSLSAGNMQIVLASFDGLTKAYRTMALKLDALQTNQMTIEIPSEEPGIKQSKFTLKRMAN